MKLDNKEFLSSHCTTDASEFTFQCEEMIDDLTRVLDDKPLLTEINAHSMIEMLRDVLRKINHVAEIKP